MDFSIQRYHYNNFLSSYLFTNTLGINCLIDVISLSFTKENALINKKFHHKEVLIKIILSHCLKY